MELEKTTGLSAATFIQAHNLSFVISSNEASDINERSNEWRPQIYHTMALVHCLQTSLQSAKYHIRKQINVSEVSSLSRIFNP